MNENFGDADWQDQIAKTKKLEPIVSKLGITTANLAYAWVLKNPRVSSAITGASRPEQVYESVKALSAVELLTDEIMAEIDEIMGNKPPAMVKRFG